jgi:glycosyltransferase involved in cell wall biosynthesis
MEGEHFGIAPVEGLASGCIAIVHDSGGMQEFIPEDYRWRTYEDLKSKIINLMEFSETSQNWDSTRPQLWKKISVLTPETFQEQIWFNVKPILGIP